MTFKYISIISNATGNLYIKTTGADKDIVFEADDGSGGTVAEYFRLDGSFEKTVFSKDIFLNDSVKALFGNSSDLQIYHNGSNNISFITNSNAAGLRLQSDELIIFAANGTTARADFDIAVKLFYNDSKKFETTNTGVTVTGEGTFTGNLNVNGNATLGDATTDDHVFNGQVTQVTGDALGYKLLRSNGATSMLISATSDAEIEFGTDNGSGTNTTQWTIGKDGTDNSFRISNSASLGTSDTLTLVGANATFAGDITLGANHIGRDEDNYIGFETDNLIKLRVAGATQLKISDGIFSPQTDSDVDLGSSGTRFKELWVDSINGGSVVPGSYLPLAGGTMTGNINLNDNVFVKFGNQPDFEIGHDASNSYITHSGVGNLIIRNTEDNADIMFQSDNGSGGITTYFKLDGSLVNGTTTLGAVNFPDKSKLFFGTDSDLRIYHDGSNSYINEAGTGDLYIQASDNMYFQTYGSGKRWITLTENAGVDLFHNDIHKLSTGAVSVGTATTAGGTLIDGWKTTTQANQ